MQHRVFKLDRFAKANSEVKQGTVVLMDFDDSLVTTVEHLGSQTFCEEEGPQTGDPSYREKFKVIRNFKNSEFEPHLTHTLTESNVVGVLNGWKNRGAFLFVLTARQPDRRERTEVLLNKFGISSYLTTTPAINLQMSGGDVELVGGVIYANNFNKKSLAFCAVIDALRAGGFRIDFGKILHIDDSAQHVNDFVAEIPRLLSVFPGGTRPTNIANITVFHYANASNVPYSACAAFVQEAEFYRTRVIISNEAATTLFEQMTDTQKVNMVTEVVQERTRRMGAERLLTDAAARIKLEEMVSGDQVRNLSEADFRQDMTHVATFVSDEASASHLRRAFPADANKIFSFKR
jgi:mRNA-degrading endonuclease toxin of MazEF toxin-antitoxin module